MAVICSQNIFKKVFGYGIGRYTLGYMYNFISGGGGG